MVREHRRGRGSEHGGGEKSVMCNREGEFYAARLSRNRRKLPTETKASQGEQIECRPEKLIPTIEVGGKGGMFKDTHTSFRAGSDSGGPRAKTTQKAPIGYGIKEGMGLKCWESSGPGRPGKTG